MSANLNFELELANDIGGFAYDPYRFALYAFPWGEGVLEGKALEQWQKEELQSIGTDLKKGRTVSEAVGDSINRVIQLAISSGHGIGKSAFLSIIILWGMSTCVDTRGVVTANTEAQLKNKTWAELAKWHRLCICGHWFELSATSLVSKFPGHEKTWRCDMVAWNEKKPEAFAGLHNKGRRILLIFDEGSAIADSIWEVAEGALTDDDTEILWLVFGNPTRNVGRFRECFGRLKHRWRNRQIDSRTVSITNKEQIQQWVDDYGEDSDFVRVRVRGVFPRAGNCQLISSELVSAAMNRHVRPEDYAHAPLVFGVDVARFGDDQCVIVKRKGLAVVEPLKKFRGVDTMDFAGIVAREIDQDRPAAVFVDAGNMGAGVVDRLHQLGYHQVIGVNFGSSAIYPAQFLNKRVEMWCLMRDWLKTPCGLPNDSELEADLIGPEYGFTGDGSKMALEKKEDMKKRGLSSPDCGDALALTFAEPVALERREAVMTAIQESNLWS